jgi:hypothetical protein
MASTAPATPTPATDDSGEPVSRIKAHIQALALFDRAFTVASRLGLNFSITYRRRGNRHSTHIEFQSEDELIGEFQ